MVNFSWLRLVCSCILTIIPGSLYARSGVVLIDQTRALVGNVTPGDAAGFPVTISRSGNYRLSGNLVIPDSDTTAIQITADFVTLDLNGFSIVGPAVCTSRPTTCPPAGKGIGVQAGGDQAFGPRGVRVLNGSVHGMGLGIMMTGDGSFVEKVTVDGNAGGGMTVAGSVIESSATNNGSFGIIATRVRDCIVLQNVGDGIVLDGSGGVATGNTSSFNGGYGIYAPFATATGNSTFLNKYFGISANCPASIIGNTIVGGDAGSIETKGTGCVLANNSTRP
jgi:hypothetical protein